MSTYNVEAKREGFAIASPPEWLVDRLSTKNGQYNHKKAASNQRRPVAEFLKGVAQPGRNDAIARAVGKLISQGYTRAAIEEQILQMADECNPPLGHDEALSVVESICAGHAERHPEWTETESDPVERDKGTRPAFTGENTTDMGNARRLAALFGDRIRSCKQIGWLVYDGKRWAPDDRSQIQALAKKTVRSIYGEAERAIDEDTRKSLGRWALSCEAAHRIQSMTALLPSEPGISVAHDDLDSDPMLLNVANGTIDLRTGELRAHNPKDLLTKISPVHYDPSAKAERWEQFVLEIMDNDLELAGFLQRLLGYGITGQTREQCWAFFWGKGANGKSTLLEAISHVLGDYAMNAAADSFIINSSGSTRNDLARLRGARIVTSSEPKSGRLDEDVIKAFCGQDKLTVRFLYHEGFEYYPQALLCFAANHRPAVRDTSHAFWRRLLFVPFLRNFEKEGIKDDGLRDQFKKEASGILNWLIQGCLEWQRSGLNKPGKVEQAVNDYRSDTDTLGDFLESTCVLTPGAQIPRQALYDTYINFCEGKNIKKTLSQRNFNENILSRDGVSQFRTGPKKVHSWRGIGLRSPEGVESTDTQAVSSSSRSCSNCDFEHGWPTEKTRRDASRCQQFSMAN